MRRVKLAVIGSGHLGRIHARLLSEMPEVELVGVADPVAAARDRVATECQTTAFADHRELVGKVDAAVVATPTRTHLAVALDFIRERTPLLVEKPLTADLSEAEDLLRAARVHDTLGQVGHIERFNPAFTAAAPHIREPRFIESVRASGFTGRSTDIGVVHDMMIHDIDLVLSLVHAPLVRVSALGMALLGRHEDTAQARLEFENGCVANLSASRVSFAAAPRRQMQVWSERGFAALDFGSRTANIVHPCDAVLERRFDYDHLNVEEKATFKERLFTDVLRVESLVVEDRNALADEQAELVAAVRDRSPVRVSAEAGRDAIAVAERILEAIRTHQWHGRADGPVGPHALPEPAILPVPHLHPNPEPRPVRREAG